jgi:L-aspartate oxidase
MSAPSAPGNPTDVVDVLVLGSGVAGLSAAIEASRLGLRARVLTKAAIVHTATRFAQGGVAAALTDDDSPELHLDDTLGAGAGLCDVDAVRALVTEGPTRVLELIGMGATFDAAHHGEKAARGPDGTLLGLAREGGHSLHRVLHAGGDATGAEIERALVAALEASTVEVHEGFRAADLLVASGRCTGVVGFDDHDRVAEVRARHVVVASGGAGQLYSVTTNPTLSTGTGVAMALRAGVAVADLEFVQFHPTALDQDVMPRPLLSEALRGDGAILRDQHGVAFMASVHPLADLAPRDVVARAIAHRLNEHGLTHLWLDATSIPDFPQRFPTIWGSCQRVGLDPRRDWLPVAPAAHYLCGGIVTDLNGASSLPNLWACGEVAASGVHGANRLASNSLLDGLVFGVRSARAIASGIETPTETGAMRGVPLGEWSCPPAPPATDRPTTRQVAADAPSPTPSTNGSSVADATTIARGALQRQMTVGAGVLRDRAGLASTARELDRIAASVRGGPWAGRDEADLNDLVGVATALVTAAAAREESRGSHTRTDFPDASDTCRGRFVHLAGGVVRFVPLPDPDRAGRR